MDESKILLESAIKTTNKMITNAEYSHLNLLEDYQTYEKSPMPSKKEPTPSPNPFPPTFI